MRRPNRSSGVRTPRPYAMFHAEQRLHRQAALVLPLPLVLALSLPLVLAVEVEVEMEVDLQVLQVEHVRHPRLIIAIADID